MKQEESNNLLDGLMNVDCLAADGMASLPDHSVDAVIVDPPYGTTRNRWDTALPLEELWSEYKRVLKPDGVVLMFAQLPYDKVLACSNLKWLRYEYIWVKE